MEEISKRLAAFAQKWQILAQSELERNGTLSTDSENYMFSKTSLIHPDWEIRDLLTGELRSVAVGTRNKPRETAGGVICHSSDKCGSLTNLIMGQ